MCKVTLGYEFISNVCRSVPFDSLGKSSLFNALIWGCWRTRQGHVTSYYGVHLQKYTSFQVHQNEEVRALLPLNSPHGCLLALMPSAVRCQMKRGLPVFTHMSKTIQDMCSLLQSPRDTVVMGGHADRIIDFDVNIAKELRVAHLKEEHAGGCPILRLHPRLICSGSARGGVRLHDPNSLEVVNTIDFHSGSLSDLDVQGDTIVTVGFHSTWAKLFQNILSYLFL